MSTEAEIVAEVVLACPHCNAQIVPNANFCWLCGAKYVAASPAYAATKGKTPESGQRGIVWLAVGLVAVIGFGVLMFQDSLLAMLYLAGVVPTLLVVLIGTSAARRRGQPWSSGKTAAVAVTTATTSVASTIGILLMVIAVSVLVMVAMVIALFAMCMAALGGGH